MSDAKEIGWKILTKPRMYPAKLKALRPITRFIVKFAIKRAGGVKEKTATNVMMTLAKSPRLFLTWLPFVSRLMPYGRLPRLDTERVILRVGFRTKSRYEWVQHVSIAQGEGMSLEEIYSYQEEDSELWTERTRVLIKATDMLIQDHHLDNKTWISLREHLSESKCMEFLLLVGQYTMLAMTLNSTGVQLEDHYKEYIKQIENKK